MVPILLKPAFCRLYFCVAIVAINASSPEESLDYRLTGNIESLIREGANVAGVGAAFIAETQTREGESLSLFGSFKAISEGKSVAESADAFRLRTWNVSIQPGNGIRFLCGSVSMSGLASVAMAPVPSDPAPFHLPRVPADDSVLSPGDALETDRFALEWHATPVRAAIVIAQDPKAPSFATISLIGRDSRGNGLEAALYSGTRKIMPAQDDAWFPESMLVPERRQTQGGAGFLIKYGPTIASATGFLTIDDIGYRAATGNLEFALVSSILSVSGGYASADRDFIGMGGRNDGTLERLYIAPAVSFLPLFPEFTKLRLGGAFVRNKEQADRPWKADSEEDLVRVTTEGEIKNFKVSATALIDDDGREFRGLAETLLPFVPSTRLALNVTGIPDVVTARYSVGIQLETGAIKTFAVTLGGETEFVENGTTDISRLLVRCVICRGTEQALYIDFDKKYVEKEEQLALGMGLRIHLR